MNFDPKKSTHSTVSRLEDDRFVYVCLPKKLVRGELWTPLLGNSDDHGVLESPRSGAVEATTVLRYLETFREGDPMACVILKCLYGEGTTVLSYLKTFIWRGDHCPSLF